MGKSKGKGAPQPASDQPVKRGRGGYREGAGRKPKLVEDALKRYGQTFQRLLDQRYEKLALAYLKFAETDPATARHMVDKAFPTLSKSEIVGKDGKPLVPVSIVMPDLDTPTPDTPTPDNQEPVPPADELH